MPWRWWQSVVAIMVLVACATPPAQTSAPRSTFKVALLLPGPIDDTSWSQTGYEGLQLIEQRLGAQTTFRASVPASEYTQTFTRYAEQGFDLIIGHGSQFYPAAEDVASRFPRTKFVVVGNFPGNNRNLGSVSFRDGETGYLVGVVAALKTKTKRIAYIGGMDNGAQQEAIALVKRGARSIAPSATVSVRWVGNWTDRDQAKQLANEEIAAGADVLIQNADMAGEGVFAAASAANVYAIGWAQDQHAIAPNVILTSAVQRVPVLLLQAADLVHRGRWEGKRYAFGLRDGALDLAPSYGLLTPTEETVVRETRDAILTGAINTFP